MDKRSIIGFALIGLVFIMWVNNYQKRMVEWKKKNAPSPQAQKDNADTVGDTTTDKTGPDATNITKEPNHKVDPTLPNTDVPLQNDIRLANPNLKYSLVFSNRGACLIDAHLDPAEYSQKAGGKEGVWLLKNTEPGKYPKTLYNSRGNLRRLSPRVKRDLKNGVATLMLRDPSKDKPLPFDTQHYQYKKEKDGSVVFTTTFANGLALEKRFTPVEGNNTLKVAITFTN